MTSTDITLIGVPPEEAGDLQDRSDAKNLPIVAAFTRANIRLLWFERNIRISSVRIMARYVFRKRRRIT